MPEFPYTPRESMDPHSGLVTYETDYYSGSQVQVMIGDVLVDNAVSVSFQSMQSRSPIHGYASPYFDFVAEGPILVRGSLVVGFKESGQLLMSLQRFHNTQGNSVRYVEDEYGRRVPAKTAGKLLSAAGHGDLGNKGRVAYRNIEQIRQAAVDSGNRLAYSDLVTSLHALTDTEFEDAAEVFEDVLWTGASRSTGTRDSMYSRNLSEDPADKISRNQALGRRRADQYPPCDIWVTYGDMRAPDGINHTVVKLLDVYFEGQSQTITSNGEPVYEELPFLARNRV